MYELKNLLNILNDLDLPSDGEKKQRIFFKSLSDQYRSHKFNNSLRDKGHLSAYLSARAPATYMANVNVLNELAQRLPHLELESLLDLGSGPGIGGWAVKKIYPHLTKATFVDKNPFWKELGPSFTEPLNLQEAAWIQKNFLQIEEFSPHDLVLLSYSLGEVSSQMTNNFFKLLWERVKKILVIIEPGTPFGFSQIRHARDKLLTLGAHLVAPCPHCKDCPLPTSDWCHFSQRVDRSSIHRKIKNATLSYEDEKFSYLIFAKNEISSAVNARILRHPWKGSGYLKLTLCTQEAKIEQKTISRKEGEIYSKAKKLEWGDSI